MRGPIAAADARRCCEEIAAQLQSDRQSRFGQFHRISRREWRASAGDVVDELLDDDLHEAIFQRRRMQAVLTHADRLARHRIDLPPRESRLSIDQHGARRNQHLLPFEQGVDHVRQRLIRKIIRIQPAILVRLKQHRIDTLRRHLVEDAHCRQRNSAGALRQRLALEDRFVQSLTPLRHLFRRRGLPRIGDRFH